MPHVNGDLFEAAVEYAHQPSVPARPDGVAHVFGRHRVVRLGDLDVAVAMDDALVFVEERETFGGQRQQRALLALEKLPHLLLGRAVNAQIGDVLFPVQQMRVLFRQRGEDAAL